jgi:hypothetical protein
MTYTQSEKMEIIRMVEESSLSVKQTLRKLGLPGRIPPARTSVASRIGRQSGGRARCFA